MKFSAAERRGALIVLGILVLIGAWQVRRYYLSQSQAPEKPHGPEQAVVDMPTTLVELNGADTTDLMRVQGIGPSYARRIVRYRALVGGFRSVEDLLQVYGMTPENFARIEPQVFVDTTGPAYAVLKAARPQQKGRDFPPRDYGSSKAWPEKGTQVALMGSSVPPRADSSSRYKPSASRAPLVINLNTADSSALVKVPGIGPGTVGRILKYRERLLFFKSLDQLAEVWGLRPENLERMRPHLSVGENFDAYPRIYLNKWDVDHLGRHPYIGFKDARILVAYREQHGPFANLDALRWVQGIDSRLPGRLEGYVVF